MSKKIALKRLTASDLTFFEPQFRTIGAGNQKAINLNRNIFQTLLYPDIPEYALERQGRFPINLNILGPGSYALYNLQRKIVKFGTYKNWRLNGEFVYNPPENNERFDNLRVGDLAIMDFAGENYPHGLNLYLIGQGFEVDEGVFDVFNNHLGKSKMLSLTTGVLADLLQESAVRDDHPLRTILDTDEELTGYVEQTGVSDERFITEPSRYSISQNDLREAKERAERTGLLGEELINAFLLKQLSKGEISKFVWLAYTNAIAPYDFRYTDPERQEIILDVKSTRGPFTNNFYVSLNELRAMAVRSERYDIYRCYEVTQDACKLRIAKGLKDFAAEILKSFGALPYGVIPNGIAVKTDALDFGEEIIVRTDELEQDSEEV